MDFIMPDEQPDGLPEDVPEEKLKELADVLSDKSRKIGLYSLGVGFIEDPDSEEGEPSQHTLVMQYQIGDIAFSPRVQDPETDQMNDEFRKIATATIDDDVEEIKKRYLKNPDIEDEE